MDHTVGHFFKANMMYCLGFLNKYDRLDEHHGEFLIHGHELCCLISSAPNDLEEQQSYSLEISYQVFDDYVVKPYTAAESVPKPFVREGDSLRYQLTGIFHGDQFSVGNLLFQDEALLQHFPSLEGYWITLTVDRLDVAILSSSAGASYQ